MNVAAKRTGWSMEEFLEWEARQEGRWEFDGFEPRLMTGGSTIHNQIVGALEFAIRRRLSAPCRVFRETMRLKLARTLRYPDLMVVCSPLTFATELTDPVLLVEVLSPSSLKNDRIYKNREYEELLSVQRYIVLEQDVTAAEVYSRQGDLWVRSTVINEGNLVMPEIGMEVPLAEIYAGLGVSPLELKSDNEPESA